MQHPPRPPAAAAAGCRRWGWAGPGPNCGCMGQGARAQRDASGTRANGEWSASCTRRDRQGGAPPNSHCSAPPTAHSNAPAAAAPGCRTGARHPAAAGGRVGRLQLRLHLPSLHTSCPRRPRARAHLHRRHTRLPALEASLSSATRSWPATAGDPWGTARLRSVSLRDPESACSSSRSARGFSSGEGARVCVCGGGGRAQQQVGSGAFKWGGKGGGGRAQQQVSWGDFLWGGELGG